MIRGELEAYAEHLADKPEVVALTKADALLDEQLDEAKAALEAECGKPVHVISSVAGRNVKPVLRQLAKHVTGEDIEEDDAPLSEDSEGWAP